MIGKVNTGNHIRGLLNYCYYESNSKQKRGRNKDFNKIGVRGEYLFSQNLDILYLADGRINIDSVINQFEEVTQLNLKCSKPYWHQSFSFPVGENLSIDQLSQIIYDFSKYFGFDDKQLIAFKHTDKQHLHFHIIANRLDTFGKNAIKTSNNFEKTNHFCRMIEKKYNLTSVENQKQTRIDGKKESLNSKTVHELRQIVDQALEKSSDYNAFREALQIKGIETLTNRGIVFKIKKNGFLIKGSDLGRQYSHKSILKRLNNESFDKSNLMFERDKLISVLRKILKIEKTHSKFEQALIKARYSYQIVEFKVNEGRIEKEIIFRKSEWGNKYVSGSQLGNDFTLGQLSKYFDLEKQHLSIHPENRYLQESRSIFDTVRTTNAETNSDLSKIDRNLSINKYSDNQGIKVTTEKREPKKLKKR